MADTAGPTQAFERFGLEPPACAAGSRFRALNPGTSRTKDFRSNYRPLIEAVINAVCSTRNGGVDPLNACLAALLPPKQHARIRQWLDDQGKRTDAVISRNEAGLITAYNALADRKGRAGMFDRQRLLSCLSQIPFHRLKKEIPLLTRNRLADASRHRCYPG